MIEKLKKEEYDYFVSKIELIESKLPHKIYPIQNIEIYWDSEMTTDNGILGCFKWQKGKVIYLNPTGKVMPEMLISTVAHELHHIWQFKKYKFLYFLMLIPILRQLFLEKTAIEVEKEADRLLNLDGLRDI